MATSTVTPATGTALRKVFSLLEDNFNATEGVYLHGFSDESIAKETGISAEAVKNYRTAAFGKLKPPSELYKAVQDLADLETLFLKTESEMKEKLKDLQARIRLIQKRFD
jgi:predicted transcriptional regulator